MMTAHDALVVAAAVLLPGVAYMAGTTALRTWRRGRRRALMGYVPMVRLQPYSRLFNEE